jgi:hypothetical protein
LQNNVLANAEVIRLLLGGSGVHLLRYLRLSWITKQ